MITRTREAAGIVATAKTFKSTNIIMRASRTGNYISVSLCDEELGIQIQVRYSDLEKLIKEVKL